MKVLKEYFDSFYVEDDLEKTLENFYNALKEFLEE